MRITSNKSSNTSLTRSLKTLPFIRQMTKLSRSTLNSSTKQSFSSLNCTTNISEPLQKLIKRPNISAESWVISTTNGRIIDSHNSNSIREIASLTKIMTCIIVIEEVFRTRRTFQEYIHVSEFSCNVIGTKAGLKPTDSLKIWDLLHGLMLPSGNDAALVLAECIGKNIDQKGNPISNFVGKMNSTAKFLGLDLTSFNNPHGLSNTINLSSASNVAILASYAMKIPVFSKIVNTPSYECTVYNKFGIRRVMWVNTNKLLWKGFCGVKTGYTPAAGPCLCCCAQEWKDKIVIVMLGVKTMKARWQEAMRLWKWALQEF